MKSRLLAVQLWGLGDLALAHEFLNRAQDRYEVTLLAKPYARALQAKFWPRITLVPFIAPWTRFRGKYKLWNWPWPSIASTLSTLRQSRFEWAVSARRDPRDHLLMRLSGARRRVGFPRLGSGLFLTRALEKRHEKQHEYDSWRQVGETLDLEIPDRRSLADSRRRPGPVLIHSGAAQAVRVWPLERFAGIARRLRKEGSEVRILCDPGQLDAWKASDFPNAQSPSSVEELIERIEPASRFIGNDSGPGHLAAILGIPTFTLFGPQLPEWFLPPHPRAEFIEGKPCPYKPCFDYCRFEKPHCLHDSTEEEVWNAIRRWIE